MNPLLINGFKWDMRIYVLVTSIWPLKIYLYGEGLVRFCTEKYSNKDIDSKFSHLTNTSINKYAPNLGSGCKWSFDQLKTYFHKKDLDYEAMWVKIRRIILLTLVNFTSNVQNYDWWFELLGFDIIIDNKMKPWLLEVNTPPALGIDEPTDELIKPALAKDILNTLDFEKYEEFKSKIEQESIMKKQKQNYFFKTRFKSQRNPSWNPTTYKSKIKPKLNGPNPLENSTKGPSNLKSTSNNSLFVAHEKLNFNNQSSKAISNNYNSNHSINATSPSSLDWSAMAQRSNKWMKQFKNREPRSFYSSLGNKNKQTMDRNKPRVSATTRPPPYFKYSYTSILPSQKDSTTADSQVSLGLQLTFWSM